MRGRFFPTWGIFALTACGGEAAENARATAWDAEIAVDAALGTDGATGVPDAAPDPDAMPPAPASVGVTGNAFNFASQGGSLIGGVVSVLERPGVTATTTDEASVARSQAAAALMSAPAMPLFWPVLRRAQRAPLR